MRKLLFILLAFSGLSAAGSVTQEADTIAGKNLDEVVVKAKHRWVEDDHVVFVPTRQERKLSDSPASLIDAMHLTMLKGRDGVVTTAAGDEVSIFINGVRADKVDVATFWPKEVKRIEYFENPADPTFEGSKYVLNFVMDRYVVGGVTRLFGYQTIPNRGYYDAASKLVYRKMTYGVLFNGQYDRNHQSSTQGTTTYRDLFYNGQHYDEINRDETTGDYTREQGLNFTFKAQYNGEKLRFSHSFSLYDRHNPGSGGNGANHWSPDIFKSESSQYFNKSKSLSPQLTGSYVYYFSNDFTGALYWKYIHADNKADSWTQFGDNQKIFNNTNESVNTFSISAVPYLNLSSRVLLKLTLSANIDWFRTAYTGSATTIARQKQQQYLANVDLSWRPNEKVDLTLTPEMRIYLSRIGELSQRSYNPTMNFLMRWYPSESLIFNASLRYYMEKPSAAESNPVLVKTSDLMWTAGNPWLRNLGSWDSYIYSGYMPNDWLDFSLGAGYVRTKNEQMTSYAPGTEEQGGLIQTIINAPSTDRFRVIFDASAKFFDRKLSLSVSPHWHYVRVRDNSHLTLNHLQLSASASLTTGNFDIRASYEGPYKDIDMGGLERTWTQGRCNIGASYGNGNVLLRFEIRNIFNKYSKQTSDYYSQYFASKIASSSIGRQFYFSVSWTFGYGRKVSSDINVSSPESVKTSVYSNQ